MLDWQNITNAPVWDDMSGFGSNGNTSNIESTMKGYCVDSGPFANLQVLYLDSRLSQHCLSRGFESGETLTALGQHLRPEALEDLMEIPDYNTFNLMLEDGPHDAVPRSIRGDFSLFTAPYGKVLLVPFHTDLHLLTPCSRSGILPSPHPARPALVDLAAT